jgi:hypothetical protein
MRETTVERFAQELPSMLDAAQQERILVTRDGQPIAVVVGIEFKDDEDLRLEADSEFWAMIEERRSRPTVRLKDVEAELFADEP